MTIRNDVYDLLCLFEGVNPSSAYKLHLLPDDWRERVKQQCHVRSQVPDTLEAAYEIALGEALLKQHILEPNEQLNLYKSHGLPVPDPITNKNVRIRLDSLSTFTGK